MASSHSAALGGQHQLPATIQPLQTLTQSFVAKQQQQNRHGTGAYSSAFSNGPSPLQHLSSSPSLPQQPHTQQQPQSSHRPYEISGAVSTAQQQSQSAEEACADRDVLMQTEDAPSSSVTEAPEMADATGANTSVVTATSSSNERRKRGRPKGSKTKRIGTKGESQEQLHQQEVLMTTEPSTTTTSPSMPHSQPPQAKPPQGTDDAVTGPDEKRADPFDSSFFPFLVPTPEPASGQMGRSDSRPLEQVQTRSPSRDDKSIVQSNEQTAKKSVKSPNGRRLPSNTDGSHSHEDTFPVYQFYWNTMTLCSDFFQAATDLLSATPGPVLARAFGSLQQPAPLQLLEQAKALCDSLMADPASLTDVQIPADLIQRIPSTLARRRGATNASMPWTTDQLLASAAASAAALKNQHSSLSYAEPKGVFGSHRPAASQQTVTNVNANPAPVSHHSDSLELATPTAPFMNPLPQHHHQSDPPANQIGPAQSPSLSEQGSLAPGFMQYPQATSPYPPSTSHYNPAQQHMYPGQPQPPAPHSYRVPPQQQHRHQSTTPKSHPASAYPWNATVGSSPENNISKLPPTSVADNTTISPATTAQSTSTAGTSATMLPSGSSRPSTATHDSHGPSPVIPNYPAPDLIQPQTAGQQDQIQCSLQMNIQPQRTMAHPIAMQMSAAAAGVSPPMSSQNPYLGHSAPYQHSHRNSISLQRSNDVGEWTAEEGARLRAIIRNSNVTVGYPNVNGSGGATETDWQKVVAAFNGTRPRHHILNKAVALNYPVPPFMLVAPATPTSAPGPLITSEQQQPRKRRRMEGVPESPASSAAEMGVGAGAATTAPSPVMQSPSGLSSAQILTPQSTAPPPLQGFPTASPHMLHSSYGNSPSMGPPAKPQQLQQQPPQQQAQRPVPPPMYNPGPRLPSATPGAMPVYRVVPAQQHLHQQSGVQSNNTSPHTPGFLQSPVSIYPSQATRQPGSNGTPTPAIYPSMSFANSSSTGLGLAGATAPTGPNAAAPNGANGGATPSPRVSRPNGESSPHGGNSGPGAGTTTRRAAAAAANAANTTSGPTTHYSHPFVNYSAPARAPPPSYAPASSAHSKLKKNADKNSQLLPSAGLNVNGKKGGTGPANGKPGAA